MSDDNKNNNTSEAAGDSAVPESGITDPRDSDVLCGRGGAALRHPGNQTYRRLVNLNKGLYITCLKTEKLKISRSIVAAIREQNGRFLEKDPKQQNCWFDIGDKKAVEKTSQALREGQPRLRKKIVEMGGGVAGTAAFMEAQYGHTGLYNPEQVGLTSANNLGGGPVSDSQNAAVIAQRNMLRQQDITSMQPPSMGSLSSSSQRGDMHPDRLMQRLSLSDVSGLTSTSASPAMESRGMAQRMHRMRNSHNMNNHLGIQESQHSVMSDFSLYGGTVHSFSTASGQYEPNNLNPLSAPLNNDSLSTLQMETSFRKSLAGLASLPQNSGHFSSGGIDNFSLHSMDMSGHTPIPVSSINGTAGFSIGSVASGSTSNSRGGGGGDKMMGPMDRRRVFAKMKYDRPPSDRRPKASSSSSQMPAASGHSNSDGMQEFNMLESSGSIFSNFSSFDVSNHAATSQTTTDMASRQQQLQQQQAQQQQQQSQQSQQQQPHSQQQSHRPRDTYVPPKPIVETAKVIDHSRMNAYSDVMGAGSRHSIMSGLSRISDTSIDHSIFSDLSRKIGNVSTRSLAMSEISTMDIAERDNESTASTRNLGGGAATFHLAPSVIDEAKNDPPLEFQY